MSADEQIKINFEVAAGEDHCSFTLLVSAEEPLSYEDFLDALAAFLSTELEEETEH